MSETEQRVWVEQTGGNGSAVPRTEGNAAVTQNPQMAGMGMAGANGPNGNYAAPNGMPLPPAPYMVVPGKPPVQDTEETKRMKENYGFLAPAAFVYAVFYAFCMYKNASGITFPFFVGGSLVFFCLSFSKLGITLKKGSVFYMAAMILLGISTFCTDDARIIFFNKLGAFLLLMSFLLKQYFNTAGWKLGKFISSICVLVFASFGELARPISDGVAYGKGREKKLDKRIWYFALGLLLGIPLLFVVLLLLASADAIFSQMTNNLLRAINLDNIFNVLFRIAVLFFASYALTAYLCKKKIREEVPDRRRGEPVLAITVTSLLTIVYLLFSGIQIGGLFLGRLQLPQGYTYAVYAREGFFQLLAVSFLNLVIVLACLSYFRESRVLKGILTVMSLCTFIMIASSAMRMIIYIRYYYLTFLRILVLWGLALLAALFVGVVIHIFREKFPLFRYSMAVTAVLYLALSFAHPDYIIARVNVANAPGAGNVWQNAEDGFFLAGEPYQDYDYLRGLSADAAPVLVPYLEELGYHMEAFYKESPVVYAQEIGAIGSGARTAYPGQESFGYYWMSKQRKILDSLDIRTFNLSRYRVLRLFDR